MCLEEGEQLLLVLGGVVSVATEFLDTHLSGLCEASEALWDVVSCVHYLMKAESLILLIQGLFLE